MATKTSSYHHGDLREALLTEAADMIAAEGADGLTMRGIGQRLGVSRAAPYRHFEDKSALLVAVAAAGFERLHARLEAAAAAKTRSEVKRLQRIGEAYVRFAIDNPAHYRLMYGREAITRAQVPELRDAGNALFEHFVGIIERHQRSGAIKKQDARAQAYVAWGAVHGLASLIIEGQILSDVDVDRLIGQAMSTLLDGLRARP